MKIKCLIVSKSEIFFQGIKSILSDFEFSIDFSNYNNGQFLLNSDQIVNANVIIIGNKAESGIPNLINSILDLNKQITIICLLDKTSYHMASYLIELGAKACFDFDIDPSEFVFGTKTVLQNKKYISQNITYQLIDQNSPKSSRINESILLSKKEKIVLNHLLEGKSNKEISSMLNLKQTTICTHKKNIFEKFKTRSLIQINDSLKNSA
jgi:DNA-binding NarL/FixJ family response regulator